MEQLDTTDDAEDRDKTDQQSDHDRNARISSAPRTTSTRPTHTTPIDTAWISSVT